MYDTLTTADFTRLYCVRYNNNSRFYKTILCTRYDTLTLMYRTQYSLVKSAVDGIEKKEAKYQVIIVRTKEKHYMSCYGKTCTNVYTYVQKYSQVLYSHHLFQKSGVGALPTIKRP